MASIPKLANLFTALAALLIVTGCASKTRTAIVSDTGGIESTPILRAPNNSDPSELYIAWVNQPGSGDPTVYFRRVHVKTNPLASSIPLGPAVNGQLSGLDMAVSNPYIYVAIHHWPRGGTFEAFLAASDNSGVSFRPAVNVSNSTTAHSYYPRVTARGAQVFVSWLEQTTTTGRYEVRVRESTDGGQNFGGADVLTSSAPNFAPQIAISGQEVYVAYCELTGVSFVRRRSLAGGAWQAPERLTSATSVSNCGYEALAADSSQFNPNYIHAVWVERDAATGYDTLSVKRSSNGGVFTDAGRMPSVWPVRSVRAGSNYGDRVHIAVVLLTDSTYNNEEAFFLRTETPTTLSNPVSLGGAILGNPQSVTISPGGEYTAVTWSTTPGNRIVLSEPYYVGDRAPTAVWLDDENGNSLVGISPDVQRRTKDVYIAWRQNTQIRLYSRRGWRWQGQ